MNCAPCGKKGRWEMPEYRLKTPALARKVVGLYRKIEQGTVLAYKKIEDRFVDAFLEKVENAAQKEDEEAQADAGQPWGLNRGRFPQAGLASAVLTLYDERKADDSGCAGSDTNGCSPAAACWRRSLRKNGSCCRAVVWTGRCTPRAVRLRWMRQRCWRRES